MSNNFEDVLQVSATLYTQLGEFAESEDRERFIEEINSKLDERDEKILQLKLNGFVYDETQKSHKMLFELDQGIKARLKTVLDSVKLDLKELQVTKRNEKQYTNPYGHVQTMDGMYYDKKK